VLFRTTRRGVGSTPVSVDGARSCSMAHSGACGSTHVAGAPLESERGPMGGLPRWVSRRLCARTLRATGSRGGRHDGRHSSTPAHAVKGRGKARHRRGVEWEAPQFGIGRGSYSAPRRSACWPGPAYSCWTESWMVLSTEPSPGRRSPAVRPAWPATARVRPQPV
jgi:hypothetical protein